MIPKRLSAFLARPFVRDVSALQGAQAVGLVLSFAGSVLLVRHLGDEGYGLYALALALFGVLRLPLDPGLDGTVIPRVAEGRAAKDEAIAAHALAYYLVLLGGVSLVMVPYFWAAGPWIADLWYPDLPGLSRLVRVLSIVGVAELTFRVASVASQGARQIREYAVLVALCQAGRTALVVVGIAAGLGVVGMTWLYVAGSAIASFWALVFWRRLTAGLPPLRSWLRRVREVPYRRYLSTGLGVAIAKDVPTVYDQVPILVLGAFFPLEVATYKIATSVANLPLLFLGPVSQGATVHLAEAYGRKDARELSRVYRRITLGSLGLSAASTAAFAAVAPLVLFAYGEDRLAALPLVYFLCLSPLCAGLGTATAPLFRTLERMGSLNRLTLPIAAVILGAGWFAIRAYGIWAAAGLIVTLRLTLRFVGLALARSILAGSPVAEIPTDPPGRTPGGASTAGPGSRT